MLSIQTSLSVFFLAGILFCALAIPLIKGKVKFNSWYGIRTLQAMQNESIWYRVNAIMGRYLFLLGTIICSLSLYFVYFPLEEDYKMVYSLLGFLIFGTVLFIKLSYNYSDKVSIEYHTKTREKDL